MTMLLRIGINFTKFCPFIIYISVFCCKPNKDAKSEPVDSELDLPPPPEEPNAEAASWAHYFNDFIGVLFRGGHCKPAAQLFYLR